MDETTSALSCGLGWIIGFQKDNFMGKQALVLEKEQGSPQKLVGFEMKDRAIARSGYILYSALTGGEAIGRVTSGSPSPSLSKNIGMGYVPASHSKLGTEIFVEIRGTRYPAQVVKRPFYASGTSKN
jgi:aminomethyltransferase